jgi:Cu/Ag efflux protein CusF
MVIHHRKTLGAAMVLCSIALSGVPWQPACAQASAANPGPDAVGVAAVLHTHATVVGIDAANNSITLKAPAGDVVDVAIDPQVGDVSKLHVGDVLDIDYHSALLVKVEKVKGNGIRERIETTSVVPASGGATSAARTVDVLATVQKIDQKHRHLTLRGPSRTVTLEVARDIDISHLKVGDSVRAVFVSATAVQVQPRAAN